ncbi:MAG: glycosyltransferase [Phycisphaerae bacterium]
MFDEPPSPSQTGAGSLRVLYVTDRFDAPYLYRCDHAVRQLRADGAGCDVASLADSTRIDLAPYSVVVLFRLPWSPRVAALIDRARAGGAAIVFDIDDLVFDPARVDALPFLRGAPAWLAARYRLLAERLQRTFLAADLFVGATPALADAARALGKPAVVHPNLLHPATLAVADQVARWRRSRELPPVISFLSGSLTHNADFAAIGAPLRRVLDERPDVRLLVVGFVELDDELARFGDRVVRVPFCDWRVQPWLAGLATVNLAPLAELDAFSHSKSALKFFESAAVGVPTIASPTAPMLAAFEPGREGFIARSADEWLAALRAALAPETAARVGAAARAAALARHAHAGHRGRLRDLLAAVQGRAARSDAPPRPLPEFDAQGRALSRWQRLSAALSRAATVRRIGRFALSPARLSDPLRCRAAIPAYAAVQIHPGGAASANSSIEPADSPPAEEQLFVAGPAELVTTWQPGPGVQAANVGVGDGWMRSDHDDPVLLGPPLAPPLVRPSVLRVRMSAESEFIDIFAQLFWSDGPAPAFCESASARFPVLADGQPHEYVVSLPVAPGSIGRLRFDPLNAPGRFRIERIELRGPAAGTVCEATAAPGSAGGGRAVDIVVPIYNAAADVRRCIESVLRHAAGADWRLVLIDDCSTDRELAAELDRVAADHPRVVLLRNERNAGFVVSANRGMAHAAGRDVLLLNSDTIVTAGFLDRLADAASGDAGIACPFTNNGTICSIPEWLRDNPLPPGLSIDDYGELVRRVSLRRRPELVTAVGFCMYIRADVLARVGRFDEAHFGRGFGEENDFCERAKRAGYRVRLADDLFVAHVGKASFADEGRALEQKNSVVMRRLHPRYFDDVAEFCARQPLAEEIANVRYHLARRAARRCPAMLFVLHADPFAAQRGGTEHHVCDLVRELALPRAVLLYPDFDSLVAAEVLDGRLSDATSHRFPVPHMLPRFSLRDAPVEAALGRVLDLFEVGVAHLHHLLNLPVGAWRELERRRIDYAYSIHDYYCVCPCLNLTNVQTGRLCEGAPTSGPACGACLAAQFGSLGLPPPPDVAALLAAHREEFAALLDGACALIAPSQAAIDLVRRHFPDRAWPVQVIEHGHDVPPAESPGTRPDEPLRVALIGQNAYPAKGAASYLELATATRHLPIEWHLFGATQVFKFDDRFSRAAGSRRVRLHGAYRRADICTLLAEQRIDLAAILSVAPETHCFALSEGWRAGVPALVTPVGALPERVARTGAGRVVGTVAAAAAQLERWCAARDELVELRRCAQAAPRRTLAEDAADHRRLFGDRLTRLAQPQADRPIDAADRTLFAACWLAQRHEAPRDGIVPVLPYQRARWYRYYRRVRGLVPPFARSAARRVALRLIAAADRARHSG